MFMPCDCPDNQPRPTSIGGCNYLVYSGGPWASFYHLVEQALPDAEMTHGRPIVHPDGSLEFPGPPPEIPGYRQEDRRLCPDLAPCALRMLKVQVVDGVLGITGVCGNLQSTQSGQEVSPDHCRDCLVRHN